MNSGVCGIVLLQTPSPVVLRPLPGLIPVTQRRSHPPAECLRARLLSPLRGDQQATAGSMMDVEALALKGSLGSQCRRIPVALGAHR